jgi:hypothetical protein
MLFAPMLFITTVFRDATNDAPVWILTVLAVYIFSTKTCNEKEKFLILSLLSSGFITWKVTHISLLILWLAALWLVWQKAKDITIVLTGILLLGLLTLPAILRNILMSGYIIYPVLPVPLGLLDWTVTLETARGANNPTHYGLPMETSKFSMTWIRYFFTEFYHLIDTIIVISSYVLTLVLWIVFRYKSSWNSLNNRILLLTISVSLPFLFFIGTPSLRYGLGVYAVATLFPIGLILKDWRTQIPNKVILIVFLLFAGYRTVKQFNTNCIGVEGIIQPERSITSFTSKSHSNGITYYTPQSTVSLPVCKVKQMDALWGTPYPWHTVREQSYFFNYIENEDPYKGFKPK